MSLVENNLRGNVFRGSTDCESSSFIEDFSETEISEFKVSIIGDEEIFWFEVSEDDVFAVKILKASRDSSGIEPGLVGSKRFDTSQVSKELSSIDKFKN